MCRVAQSTGKSQPLHAMGMTSYRGPFAGHLASKKRPTHSGLFSKIGSAFLRVALLVKDKFHRSGSYKETTQHGSSPGWGLQTFFLAMFSSSRTPPQIRTGV